MKHCTPVNFSIGADVLTACQKYEGRINQASGRDDLNAVFSEFAREHGFIRMGQLVAHNRDIANPIYTSLGYNIDEFAHEYFSQGISKIDAARLEGSRQQIPVIWGFSRHEKNGDTYKEKKFYNFHREFSNYGGLFINIYNSDFVAIMGLTSGESENDFMSKVKYQASISWFFAFMIAGAIVRLGLAGNIPPIIDKITPREKECLTWAAAGKTAWEISCILGVSERTVVAHMENAKKRLDAKTLPHAVAIAISRGMIAI